MFVARQPIFNKKMEIYGYELLFRNTEASTTYTNADPVSATAQILLGLYETGLEKITDGKKAFVNFENELLMRDDLKLIPPEYLVIEVLETVVADHLLSDKLTELKSHGYLIALDDFEEDVENYPLIPQADIIKYDLMLTPLSTIQRQVRTAKALGKILLAEKIETYEEFLQAVGMGFELFQGFFFSRPKIVGRVAGESFGKALYGRLMIELKKDEPNFDKLAEILVSDPTLVYRLVRAKSAGKKEDVVHSVKEVLQWMGLREFNHWVHIIMLQNACKDKPLELFRTALIRSRFAEKLAEFSVMSHQKSEISIMCLFRNLDAMLDMTMEEALDGIALPVDVVEALLHNQGPLMPFYNLIEAYEHGEWGSVGQELAGLNIDARVIGSEYLRAIEWAEGVISLS